MALDLDFRQSNDAKTLILTDVTETWGTDPAFTISQTENAYLDFTVTTTEGEILTSERVTLESGGSGYFTDSGGDQSQLVFLITSDDLSSSAIGNDTELPDGIYEILYHVDNGAGSSSEYTLTLLLDGVERADVYDRIRDIDLVAISEESNANFIEIVKALTSYGYLKSMQLNAFVAKTSRLLSILNTLEKRDQLWSD